MKYPLTRNARDFASCIAWAEKTTRNQALKMMHICSMLLAATALLAGCGAGYSLPEIAEESGFSSSTGSLPGGGGSATTSTGGGSSTGTTGGNCTTDTWSNFAARTLNTTCAACHTAGFMPNVQSYAAVVNESSNIRTYLQQKLMPPPGSLPALSQSDNDRLVKWIDCSLPQ